MLSDAVRDEALVAVQEQQLVVVMAHIGQHDVAFSPPRYDGGSMTFEYRAIDRGQPYPVDWQVVPCADWTFPDAD